MPLRGRSAILGWLLLIFAGRLRVVAGLIAGFIIPSMIGVVYTVSDHLKSSFSELGPR
jgi:hypothetical protein